MDRTWKMISRDASHQNAIYSSNSASDEEDESTSSFELLEAGVVLKRRSQTDSSLSDEEDPIGGRSSTKTTGSSSSSSSNSSNSDSEFEEDPHNNQTHNNCHTNDDSHANPLLIEMKKKAVLSRGVGDFCFGKGSEIKQDQKVEIISVIRIDDNYPSNKLSGVVVGVGDYVGGGFGPNQGIIINNTPSSKSSNNKKSKKEARTGIGRYLGIILALVASIVFPLAALVVKSLSNYHTYSISLWRFQGIFLPSILLVTYHRFCRQEKIFDTILPITAPGKLKTFGFLVVI
jgi:hypothetical protein